MSKEVSLEEELDGWIKAKARQVLGGVIESNETRHKPEIRKMLKNKEHFSRFFVELAVYSLLPNQPKWSAFTNNEREMSSLD